MKASAAQGAKKRTKSPQFQRIACGDENIRRRNNRAVHEKENQKYAPFSYRKSTLRVSPCKQRESARKRTAKQAYKYINKYSKLA